MAQSIRFPSTNSSSGWNSPGNMLADDGSNSTAAPAKNATIRTTYGSFGFDGAIPESATISSVSIIFQYLVDVTNSVAHFHSEALISGATQTLREETTEPTTISTFTVDHTGDRSWTRTDLLDANLGWHIGAHRGNSNNAVAFNSDFIKVAVEYSTGATVSRDVQDTFTFSDALARDGDLTRDLAESFSFTDQLQRDVELDRLLSESFVFTDQISASVGGQAQEITRNIADTFSFTEQVQRLLNIDRLLQDSLSFSDQLQRDQWLTREIAETLTFLDNLTYTSTGESASVLLPREALKRVMRMRKWREWMGYDEEALYKEHGIGPGKLRKGGGG